MQGPAWQRLAQQAHAQEAAESTQWQQQQSQHDGPAAALQQEGVEDQDGMGLGEQLPIQQQAGPSSHETLHPRQQSGLASHAIHGSLMQSMVASGMHNRPIRVHGSPKPPLPRQHPRQPIYSEMSFLGTSAGSGASANADSLSDAPV